MIDVLPSSGVPGPLFARQKETPALDFGTTPKELLYRLNLDEFLFINDPPIQSGNCISTVDSTTHQNRLYKSHSKNHIVATQKRQIPSTTTETKMTSTYVPLCVHHDKKENSTRQGTPTFPTSFQTQTTSNLYPPKTPPMKATHSGGVISASDQFAPIQFERPKTSLATKMDGSYEQFQSMAGIELNWPSKTPPTFGSVTESSPSLSSSFEFMDVPREEPISYGLPLPENILMSHLPGKTFAPETHDAPFFADSLSGSSDANCSFQYPMGTETEPWSPQYYPDRLAWPVITALHPSSWPMPEDAGVSNPEAQLIAPCHFASNNLLPLQNDHANIPSVHRPEEPDCSSSTPRGMGTAQPQPTTILQTHTGLPPMPDCTTSFSHPGLLTHSEPPQRENENPAIKASLHYSDARNALLIEWKRAGLSYKDIKRMGGFKEAESTLRGRFRTLTKAKEHRVRKPKWLKMDIQLLCEAVAACAAPASPSGSGYTSLTQANIAMLMTGQTPKVSWKKVAQYIWSHGGSYQFGNATCKKKWCDIHGIKI